MAGQHICIKIKRINFTIMKQTHITLLLLLIAAISWAQPTQTIRGTVKDKITKTA